MNDLRILCIEFPITGPGYVAGSGITVVLESQKISVEMRGTNTPRSLQQWADALHSVATAITKTIEQEEGR